MKTIITRMMRIPTYTEITFFFVLSSVIDCSELTLMA